MTCDKRLMTETNGRCPYFVPIFTFAPQLETHKLKGKLLDSWACSVGYDLRIIFDFVKSETQKEDDIFLIGIGKHDEVY